MNTTLGQQRAIDALRSAIRDCRDAGVVLFGMDDTLYASTTYDPSKDFHEQFKENSGGDSDNVEEVQVGRPYVGSDGW